MDETDRDFLVSADSEKLEQLKRHWSKDYVEHLRAVHFALVSVCVVLILLSLSQGKSEVEMARDQNRQIQDLLSDFNIGWFKESVPGAIHDLRYQQDPLQSLLFPKMSLKPKTANALELAYDVPSPRTLIIPVVMDGDNWIINSSPSSPLKGQKYDGDLSLKLPPQLAGTPQTLRAFRELWDNLADEKGLEILIPDDFGEDAYIEFPNGLIIDKVRVKFIHVDAETYAPMSLRHWNESEVLTMQYLKLDLKSDILYAGKYFANRFKPGITELDFTYTPDFTVLLPVKTYIRIPFKGQAVLIRHSAPGWKWHPGSFQDSFQQLAKIVHNYEMLPPHTISEILDGEMERSSESFEAIGLKVPAEDIVRFGIILIIGIQLYLWLHLYEKSTELRNGDEGLEVAWIGVYRSPYASTMMFVTTCMLPATAASLLGLRGLRVSSFYAHWTSAVYWSVLFAGTVITFILGLGTWRLLTDVKKKLALVSII